MNEIWVLGATGRIGQGVTERLHAAGLEVVVVGRNRARLAEKFPHSKGVAGSLEDVCRQITASAPCVVVNTVGPFASTAPMVASACPPGTHYVDVSNDFRAFEALDAMEEEAVATDRSIVYGAGFGVLATESILLHVLDGGSRPCRVRVDAIASVVTESGQLGEALAATIVDSLSATGREVRDGDLRKVHAGGMRERVMTPDGATMVTSSVGGGDLFAAWKASDATWVVGASALGPASGLARAGMAGIGGALRLPGMAAFATRQLARVSVKDPKEQPRASSWARARVEWSNGQVREGWLRAGEGMAFTMDAAAAVAQQLSQSRGRPGASSPARLLGTQVALAAGAWFLDPGQA